MGTRHVIAQRSPRPDGVHEAEEDVDEEVPADEEEEDVLQPLHLPEDHGLRVTQRRPCLETVSPAGSSLSLAIWAT